MNLHSREFPVRPSKYRDGPIASSGLLSLIRLEGKTFAISRRTDNDDRPASVETCHAQPVGLREGARALVDRVADYDGHQLLIVVLQQVGDDWQAIVTESRGFGFDLAR